MPGTRVSDHIHRSNDVVGASKLGTVLARERRPHVYHLTETFVKVSGLPPRGTRNLKIPLSVGAVVPTFGRVTIKSWEVMVGDTQRGEETLHCPSLPASLHLVCQVLPGNDLSAIR